MQKENDLWYKSIPVFLNQVPRTLESFNPNEKYEDDLFVACPDSLIKPEIYQRVINNYYSNPNNPDYEEDKKEAEILNSITIWKRISDLFPNYDLFPQKLHCDTFK